MFINNRLKQEDNSKEINAINNKNKGSGKVKLIFSKKKLEKPNQNLALLPKISQQDGKIAYIKSEKMKKPFIRSSSDVVINNYNYQININQKDKEKEEYKEELLIIKNLWEELGVTQEYQEQFNNILVYENLRKNLFNYEKENLQKFRNSLMKLRKEIINRENNIESLIRIIRAIESQNANDNLLKEVVNIIKSLRLNAVNIVFYMQKVREISFYYYFQGKWDLTKIKKDYLFNNSYLLKMRDDLNFLRNTVLKNYIEMNNSPFDAFLLNCSQRNKDNQDKIIIPITDELSKIIEQCKYTIIQDQLLDNIFNKNFSSQFCTRVNSGKMRIRKFSARSPKHSQNLNIFLSNRDINNSLNNYPQGKNNNLGKTIFLLKNENPIDYNNLFINNNQAPSFSTNLKEARKMFEKTRFKIRPNDKTKYFQDNLNNYIHNYDSPQRIIVEHDYKKNINNKNEKYSSMENLSNFESKTNKSNKSPTNKNTNDFENAKIDKILKENDKLRKDNQEIKKELLNSRKRMEDNDKLRKSLENKIKMQKEEMVKVSNSVEEIKQQLMKEKKELEEKLREEKEKNEKMEEINKNMEEKLKNQVMINKEVEIKIDEKEKKEKIEDENKNKIIQKSIEESIREEQYILNNSRSNSNENENKDNFIAITNSENENENENSFKPAIKENESNKYLKLSNNEQENIKEEGKNNNEENKNYDEENKSDEEHIINDEENNINEEKNNKEEKNNNGRNNNNEEIIIENSEKSLKKTIKQKKDENEEVVLDGENKEEMDKLIKRENEFLYIKQLSVKIVDEIMNLEECEISPDNKYKVEYYKGNISSFINEIKSSISLELIDDKIKTTFDLTNDIYNEESYLIGQYPQIIICKSYEDETKISGFCHFYYQNTKKNENKIKINIICAINDIFVQFITMINFIKNYALFNELYISLYYHKTILENKKVKYYIEPDILEYFQDKMKFKWTCVENKKSQRIQQLCYTNGTKTDEFQINKGFINSETLSLLSFIDKDSNIEVKSNFNYKYMNNLLIYSLLSSQNELIITDFGENKYRIDSSKLSSKVNPIITMFYLENGDLEEFKSKLNENILNEIEDSLLYDYYIKDNEMINSYGLIKMDLSIFFKNILSVKINNYYYNRISSNEIEIIKDTENDYVFYNIPCLSKIYNILIFEINQKMKEFLIENNSNVYELFINYYNQLGKEKSKKVAKNIFIPSFKIKTHLQSEKASKEINNININSNIGNTPIKIGTLDEFIRINFNNEKPIEKQIIYDMDENNEEDIIIKDNFILAILNNYTDINYPLFQLIYILKETWIKAEQ